MPKLVLDPTRDYYRELKLSPAADGKEIKARRKRFTLEKHPDRHFQESGEDKEKIREIEREFMDGMDTINALADPEQRRQYDYLRTQLLEATNPGTRARNLPGASLITTKFNTPFTTIQPLSQRDVPSSEELLSENPMDIEQNHYDSLDPVLFDRQFIARSTTSTLTHVPDDEQNMLSLGNDDAVASIWAEQQLYLAQATRRVETGFSDYIAATGIQPAIPQVVEDRAEFFPWSDPNADHYPPHLWIPSSGGKIPKGYSASLLKIFDRMGLYKTKEMIELNMPKCFIRQLFSSRFVDKSRGLTMADFEASNSSHRQSDTDVAQGKNIGDRKDWWSDLIFGQQQLTGTNPVSITVASGRWLKEFTDAASTQSQSTVGKSALEFIQKANPKSLFVQDFSFFREAIKVKPDALMQSGDRYTVATVSLFHLTEKGILHPISICIDYKVSMAKSVVIFNRKLKPVSDWEYKQGTKLADEKQDWPWRFAKQCAQSADWVRHEIATHLTHTHLIEEAILVAANRTLPIKHPVFRLLEPHWFRTLPLNAAARETLVPKIIFDLIGMKDKQPFDLINHFYDTFDFVGAYIPNDLPNRGFPLEELNDEKHRNYVYAKNMNLMWATIRKFVKQMLTVTYTTDASVASDEQISSWCVETKEKGRIHTFPTITTVDELIDACTMCIHIASPQHTAVNYLQNFYHVFIPSKPPALWQKPPSMLAELMKYTEEDVLKSLPINHNREWLLATQIPWLLSFRIGGNHSLLKYSEQLFNLVRHSRSDADLKTKAIAKEFHGNLRRLVETFILNSDAMTRHMVPYVVMNPTSTAVSILI